MEFSSCNRLEILRQAASQTNDIIVIGGGITGAGIALDAAARGLKVLLVEKNDFASGTSSRSTKLIHGGLRYLKQLDFKLVREVGKERAIAHRNAPHLVIPAKMLLPLIKGGSLKKNSARVALWVYEKLAGVKKEEGFRILTKQETLANEPLLNEELLSGSALYTEYRTDDARLTIEILKTAVALGARAVNYTEATGFIKDNGKITGINILEKLSEECFAMKAKVVINAAGPWVDELRGFDEIPTGKRLHLTKGVHIVVPFSRLALSQAVYMDAPDGRMIFAIPRDGVTYIGTTDTDYNGNKDLPLVNKEEAEYLVEAVNRIFPKSLLKISDIISSWAGLRPLIHEDGKAPSELSRKDELFFSKNGLISIAGGKLTGYRKMAERAVDKAAEILEKDFSMTIPLSNSASITLSGGNFSSISEIGEYVENQTGESKQIEATFAEIRSLVWKYGRNTEHIIGRGFDLWPELEDRNNILEKAEIRYCQEHEMAVFPSDFWIRRSSQLYFTPINLAAQFEKLAPFFYLYGDLTGEAARESEYSFLREVNNTMSFRG